MFLHQLCRALYAANDHMRLFDEKKAVKGLMEMSKDPSPFIKKNYAIALLGFLSSIGIILYLVFFSVNLSSTSSHLLSFLAGVWLVWSYVKVTEVYGWNFIEKYIDLQKIEARYMECGIDPEVEESTINPFLKMFLTLVIWAIIAYAILYAVNYVKNV